MTSGSCGPSALLPSQKQSSGVTITHGMIFSTIGCTIGARKPCIFGTGALKQMSASVKLLQN